MQQKTWGEYFLEHCPPAPHRPEKKRAAICESQMEYILKQSGGEVIGGEELRITVPELQGNFSKPDFLLRSIPGFDSGVEFLVEVFYGKHINQVMGLMSKKVDKYTEIARNLSNIPYVVAVVYEEGVDVNELIRQCANSFHAKIKMTISPKTVDTTEEVTLTRGTFSNNAAHLLLLCPYKGDEVVGDNQLEFQINIVGLNDNDTHLVEWAIFKLEQIMNSYNA